VFLGPGSHCSCLTGILLFWVAVFVGRFLGGRDVVEYSGRRVRLRRSRAELVLYDCIQHLSALDWGEYFFVFVRMS